MRRTPSIVALALLTASNSLAEAPDSQPDWTQWRGPDRSGVVDSVNWPMSIGESALVESWRMPLGKSYSGPVLDGQYVFVTETVNDTTEAVMAIDRQSGNEVWRHQWDGGLKVPFFAAANGSWIRATPALSDNRLIVAGMKDMLLCLDAASGKPLWEVNMPKQLGTSPPAFGFASSPMVDGEFVYVQAGGGFIKLSAEDGKIVWQALKDGGGMSGSAFASPIIATLQGVRQLVVQTRTRLVGVDLESGTELWSEEIPAFRGMNILTPTVIGDAVFTSSYGGGSFMFDIEPSGDKFAANERWANKREAYMSSPVVIDGNIYLHMRNQRFACIDAASGEEKWATRPFGKYWSMIAADNRIVALDERGDLRLIQANPEQFELVEERHISDSPTWAHLAISGDSVYVRQLDAIVAYRWQK